MRFRRRRDRRDDELSLRPISNWMLVLAVVAVLLAGFGLTRWLLSIAATDPNTSASVQIDAVRTGLSAAVGTGGAFALLLAFRRQRSTEVSAVHTITDATERRATELYTKAADQLGSDKAPVRLAGLYSLERLAQDNQSQRQTIVNVICAYLQMPYTPPGTTPVEPSADDGESSDEGAAAEDEKRADQERERYEKRLQEHEKGAQEQRVRTTAQRILHRHISRMADETIFWKTSIDLSGANLAGALLAEAALWGANLDEANLTGAFLGEANLSKASLYKANLTGAFLFEADLSRANLKEANLTGADLGEAYLTLAMLSEANLSEASLHRANLADARLDRANLTGARLDRANLTRAHLGEANLTGALLDGASWAEGTDWPTDLRDTIKTASVDDPYGGFRIRDGYRVPTSPTTGQAPQTAG